MVAQQNTPNFDIQATVDAANLIAERRWKHSGQIPLSAWKMMAHAEAKLNKELREYFVPKDKLEQPEVTEL